MGFGRNPNRPNPGMGPIGTPNTPNANPTANPGGPVAPTARVVNATPTEAANSPFARGRRPGFAQRSASGTMPSAHGSAADNPLLPMGSDPGDPNITHTPGYGLHDPNDNGTLPPGTPYAQPPTDPTAPTGSAPTTPTTPSTGPQYGGQAGTINRLYQQGLGPDGEPRGRQY